MLERWSNCLFRSTVHRSFSLTNQLIYGIIQLRPSVSLLEPAAFTMIGGIYIIRSWKESLDLSENVGLLQSARVWARTLLHSLLL